MRLILKLIAAPVALALTIVTAFFSFILSVSGALLDVAATLVFVASVILFAAGEPLGGGLFLGIAFLISPFGLPAFAGWLVRGLNTVGGALKGFILTHLSSKMPIKPMNTVLYFFIWSLQSVF